MNDTICAIATALGRAAVGIVRISGPHAHRIARAMAGPLPEPGRHSLRSIRAGDGTEVDRGLVLCFKAPHSFTGEDLVEIQGHGGPVVMHLITRICVERGARLARPGEFSERAVHNGKMDLSQAEAVADLIAAGSERAAAMAVRSLRGELSRLVLGMTEDLATLMARLEASIDFPDEGPEALDEVAAGLAALRNRLGGVVRQARDGVRSMEGVHTVLAGAPNAGKSSIINRLSGRQQSIVADEAGTTRDTTTSTIWPGGVPVHLVDTAGLRRPGSKSEAHGVERALDEIGRADHLIYVRENRSRKGAHLLARILRASKPGARITQVHNKIDLSGDRPRTLRRMHLHLYLSARTGEGIGQLRDLLLDGQGRGGDGGFSARERHLSALQQAARELAQATGQSSPEIVAEHLRRARECLAQICEQPDNEELLGKIFAEFCIGK